MSSRAIPAAAGRYLYFTCPQQASTVFAEKRAEVLKCSGEFLFADLREKTGNATQVDFSPRSRSSSEAV